MKISKLNNFKRDEYDKIVDAKIQAALSPLLTELSELKDSLNVLFGNEPKSDTENEPEQE